MKFALHGGLISTKWPPGGWKYVQNETGWRNPDPMNSFEHAKRLIQAHRKSNNGYNLSLDPLEIEEDLMHYTAIRLLSDAPDSAKDWIVALDEDAKKNFRTDSRFTRQQGQRLPPAAPAANRVERLLARVRAIGRGVATLAEWVGAGAIPVPAAVANRRAMVCASCPMNVEGGVPEGIVGEAIRDQLIVKNALSLSSEYEDRLKTCKACGCYLRLKVWVPLDKILSNQTPDVADTLHPGCWIRNESGTPTSSGSRKSSVTRTITMRRKAAFGDVILSTIVATKLREIGIGTHLITENVIGDALRGHPHLESISAMEAPLQVDLDRAYEDHPERTRKDIALLLLESADRQLRQVGLRLPDLVNRVPVLELTDEERWSTLATLQRMPRPWIVVVDGSGSWPNRQWHMGEIAKLPKLLDGTVIWSKPFGWLRPPGGFSPHQIRTFRELMAIVAHTDLVISPDTGPIHIAAAFHRKIVALEQCNDMHLRLTELSDWSSIAPPLSCIRCGAFTCPIDAAKPPCQIIQAEQVADLAKLKLSTANNGKISAIIPSYKWRSDIVKCLTPAVDQCDETILVGDASFDHPAISGVKILPGTGKRIGYGKTCQRAIRDSIGEFILLLNDDCYLDQGTVWRMKEAMTTGVGVVGALLRYPDGTIQHGGTFRSMGAMGFGHMDHRKRKSRFTEITEMESVTGACALVRREAFYEVRGFDERYDCYAEDADLCLKMRRAGWKVVFHPGATAVHVESQSTGPTKLQMLHESMGVFEGIWKSYLLENTPIFSTP